MENSGLFKNNLKTFDPYKAANIGLRHVLHLLCLSCAARASLLKSNIYNRFTYLIYLLILKSGRYFLAILQEDGEAA